MNPVFSLISASTNRLVILATASLLLLAAGDGSQALDKIGAAEASRPVSTDPVSDAILAPVAAADAAIAAAALAATTPPDVAAAYAAETAPAVPVRNPSLSGLVASMNSAELTDDQRCLATAVYFEARGEPMEGQLAVAQTILNRVGSGRYAATACGVVNQPRQFSFSRARAPTVGTDWAVAQAIARIAAEDMWHDVAPRAVSFHARRVSPNWAGKTRVAAIGNHIFYR